MTTSTAFPDLVARARDRAGLTALLAALGFNGRLEPVPAEAWGAFGLAELEVAGVAVAGRAGSLDALLVETKAPVPPDRLGALARAVRRRNPARLHLLAFATPGYAGLTLGTCGLDGGFRHLRLEPDDVRESDVQTLEEMAPANGEAGLELALRQVRALDRTRVTRRFFRDFRSRRDSLARAWTGMPVEADADRRQLALLFLSRMTFLTFLERRGALAGDRRFLVRLFGLWTDAGPRCRGSFYRTRLSPLFFGALNRRPEDRSAAARALGDLPYLNGGLFEPHPLERRNTDLDLPDEEVRSTLDDLLDRYRFTSLEAGEGAGVGVDPEMLGRVFEGLMAPDRRWDTGSFYTPAPVVNRVVKEGLAAYVAGACPGEDAQAVIEGRASSHRVRASLERIRVLDPACGSGAFLLGALQRLATAVGGPDGPAGETRRDFVARSLHGVDLLDDAALLCSLRLWLALSADDDRIRPLPNLDRRIRQGDALVDPLDAGPIDRRIPPSLARDPGLRRAARAVEPAARRYLRSGPGERDRARSELERAERHLASRWLDRAHVTETERLRRLRARACDRDLFGRPDPAAVRARTEARRAEARLREIDHARRSLDDRGSLPFFSFGVHFADAPDGFDLVLSNPPWVRSHRWPDRIRERADRFEVCTAPGWSPTGAGTRGAGGQVDLSLLFVERAIRLLAPGGVLAVLLPAKAFRALYAAAARRMLLRELEIVLLEDHALDQRSIFRADAFAGVLVARRPPKGDPPAGTPTRVRMVRRDAPDLEFRLPPGELSLDPGDPASPWVIAPPDVGAVLRRLRSAGPPLGSHPDLDVVRGVMTGANDVLVLDRVEPRLGGLARVRAVGHETARRDGAAGAEASRFLAVVETGGIRPLVRGADIDAFHYRTESYAVWCHDGEGSPADPPARLGRYLERHGERLRGRAGWRPGLPLGALFRLSPRTLGPKVAWHDLSDTLRAVALPGRVPFDGRAAELVPLNTVYFIPTADDRDARALAGMFNSVVVRTAARAIAERAKDARFRFFAWTLASIPLPAGWRRSAALPDILRLSHAAHAAGGISVADQRRLDTAVARLYGLDDEALEALVRYDRWLRGAP